MGGESAPFMLWNRNKRSVALDLKSDRDLATFTAMAGRADVVIENFKPGAVERLGIDYRTLSALNPRLVYCSISGFGQTGPYATRRGFDLVAAGMSGLMSINGPADGPPFRIPIPLTDLAAGFNGAIGILAALGPLANTRAADSTSTRRCSSPDSPSASTRPPWYSPPERYPNGSGRGIAAALRTSSFPPPTAT